MAFGGFSSMFQQPGGQGFGLGQMPQMPQMPQLPPQAMGGQMPQLPQQAMGGQMPQPGMPPRGVGNPMMGQMPQQAMGTPMAGQMPQQGMNAGAPGDSPLLKMLMGGQGGQGGVGTPLADLLMKLGPQIAQMAQGQGLGQGGVRQAMPGALPVAGGMAATQGGLPGGALQRGYLGAAGGIAPRQIINRQPRV